MKRERWTRGATGATLVGAVLAAGGCDTGEPGRIPPPEEPADVVVSRPASDGRTATFPASVRSTDRAELATRMSGTVERVPVDVGSRVARGDVLVALDDGDVEARIRSAEAAARQARRHFRRIENLEADGAATEAELDDARAGLERAEAGLQEATAQRAYAVLRAPFPGTVTARNVDPGDLTAPGRPVLRLQGTGGLEVVADLPEAWGNRVSTGDTVGVVRPETGDRLRARVARTSPAVESASRRFRLEAELLGSPPPGLLPGTFVRLELPEPGLRTLWIPSDAVLRRGQLRGAFVVDRDTLRLRWIRTGEGRAGAVEVLAGLDATAAVVRRPAPGLVDGQPVGAVREEAFRPGEAPETPPPASSSGAAASSDATSGEPISEAGGSSGGASAGSGSGADGGGR